MYDIVVYLYGIYFDGSGDDFVIICFNVMNCFFFNGFFVFYFLFLGRGINFNVGVCIVY